MAKSAKEQAWLVEYYKCLNATEAARKAGYKWANKIGPEKKQKFADEIKAHLEEKTLEAEAVLARLSDMALASLADFSDVLTLDDLKDHPKAHVVKKLRTVARELENGQMTVNTIIELHDSQAALEKLGKHYGLFTDRIDIKLQKELETALDLFEQNLEPEVYESILRLLSRSGRSQA